MPLAMKSRHAGNVYIIQCVGRITLGPESTELEIALNHASYEFHRFVLSVAELTRLDSIGLGLLVRFAARLRPRGGDLRLAAPPAFLVTLLELTQLSNVLRCYATEEEAIRSFLQQGPSATATPQKRGPRVLFVDESPELCVFVATVLRPHGIDVRSASMRDARILLEVDGADTILVGPGTPQRPSESVLRSLTPLAPRAVALRLDDNFKTLDAGEATQAILRLFNAQGHA
jgi:anti-anti-sigma factor